MLKMCSYTFVRKFFFSVLDGYSKELQVRCLSFTKFFQKIWLKVNGIQYFGSSSGTFSEAIEHLER